MSLSAVPELGNAGSSGLTVGFVHVGGLRLRVGRRAGTTGTPLLIFNGLGANLEVIQPFVEALPDVELVAFDLPGIGDSPPARLPRRLKGLARVADRLMTKLGYTGYIDVAGASWGGSLAQEYAHQYSHRVRRLVLAAASPAFLILPANREVLLRMATPQRFATPEQMRRAAPQIYGGVFRNKPELIDKLSSRLRPPTKRGYFHQLFASTGWTSVFWLHHLHMPVLIMAGDDDPIAPLAHARLMRWLMPRARLHVVRNGGHLFMFMRAHETASVIHKFLTERFDEEDHE